MITEDYVSFNTACLLKDKGFDQKCEKVYMQGELKSASCCMEGESSVDREDIRFAANYENWIEYTQGDYAVLAPTLNIALKWLREVHAIIVVIFPIRTVKGELAYNTSIYNTHAEHKKLMNKDYQSYEQACEAAIKYCLTELI